MANGKLEIEGLDELIKKINELKTDLGSSVESLSKMVKAVNDASKADLNAAKTVTELNKAVSIQTKTENESIIAKAKAEKITNEIRIATEKANKVTQEGNKILRDQNILLDENAGSLEKAEAKNRLLAAERKKLNLETKEGNARLKEINAEIDKNNQFIKENSDSLKKQKIGIGDYAQGTIGLRQEMKLLTAELVKLKLQGESDSDTYKEMAQRLGDIKDSMADVANEAKVLGSDTKNIDMMVGSVEAVGSAAQVTEGAMQLLGSQNEDVTKGIQRMMAIQSIMNGVQQIGNALQKESAFMMGLNAAKSKLAAAGQAIYTAAVGTSTGALKAFRIAMLATGIGALIVGIGLLVANWDRLSAAITGSTDALDKYNKANADAATINAIKNKKLDEEIELKKAMGKADEEISKLEEQKIKNNIEGIQAQIKATEELKQSKIDELAKSQEITAKNIALNVLTMGEAKALNSLKEKKLLNEITGLNNQTNSLENNLTEQKRLLTVFQEQQKTNNKKKVEDNEKTNKKISNSDASFYASRNEKIASLINETNEQQKEWDEQFKEDEKQRELDFIQWQKDIISETSDERMNEIEDNYAQQLLLADGNKEEIKKLDEKLTYDLATEEMNRIELLLTLAQAGSDEEQALLQRLHDIKLQLSKDAASKQLEEQEILKTKESEILKIRQKAFIDFGEGVGAATANLLLGQEDAAKQALKNIVKSSLDALKAYAYVQLGITTVGSLATPQSILTAGIAGAAQAAALAVLIEGAVTAAEYGANSLIDKFAHGTNDAPGGLAYLGDGTGMYKGRELVTLPDGSKYLTPSEPTLTYLPKHSEVTPAHLVENELREALKLDGIINKPDNSLMLELIHTIKNKPSASFNVNQNGISVIGAKGINRTKWLNSTYRGKC